MEDAPSVKRCHRRFLPHATEPFLRFLPPAAVRATTRRPTEAAQPRRRRPQQRRRRQWSSHTRICCGRASMCGLWEGGREGVPARSSGSTLPLKARFVTSIASPDKLTDGRTSAAAAADVKTERRGRFERRRHRGGGGTDGWLWKEGGREAGRSSRHRRGRLSIPPQDDRSLAAGRRAAARR